MVELLAELETTRLLPLIARQSKREGGSRLMHLEPADWTCLCFAESGREAGNQWIEEERINRLCRASCRVFLLCILARGESPRARLEGMFVVCPGKFCSSRVTVNVLRKAFSERFSVSCPM